MTLSRTHTSMITLPASLTEEAGQLFRTADIRRAEQAADLSSEAPALMERAGFAAARWLTARCPRESAILLLAGPGNNGGDALMTAAMLRQQGYAAHVWMSGAPESLPPDARRAFERALQVQVTLTQLEDHALPDPPPQLAWIVDGLFGIGLARPLDGIHARLAEWARAWCETHPTGLLALDVPSGLDADTGRIVGTADRPGVAVFATDTLTFIGNKPGLHMGSGRDHAGAVTVSTLDLDADVGLTPCAVLANSPLAPIHLPTRRHDSHKGTHGNLALIGGSAGMIGAPILGARAALKSGAGRVFIGYAAEHFPEFDPVHPELMLQHAGKVDLDAMDALVVGPGLGVEALSRALLHATLTARCPLVLDADALNLLALNPSFAELLRDREYGTVLTPHPLEAARLLEMPVDAVQADRLGAALGLSERFRATVVLKGSGTVIATRDTLPTVNTTGNGGLATAGSGDVLAGVIGALIAQGMPATDAARTAVWGHGTAADWLVQHGTGPVGLVAGELLDAIRQTLNGS